MANCHERMSINKQDNAQANQRMRQHQHPHNTNTNDEHAAANPFANANTIGYNDEQPQMDEHQREEHKRANQRMHQHQYQHNTNNMTNNTRHAIKYYDEQL